MCHNSPREIANSTWTDRRRAAAARRRRRAAARVGGARTQRADDARQRARPRRPRELPRQRRRRSRPQRLRPARDRARLRLGHDDAALANGPRGPRVGADRARQGDRGHAGRDVRRLDLQRADPGPDAARAARASCCGSSSPTAPSTRTRSTSTASTPPSMDGVPGLGAGEIEPGEQHRLRVRGAARRAAPLPLPRPAAGRAHRQGPLRRVHHRPRRTAAKTRTRW